MGLDQYIFKVETPLVAPKIYEEGSLLIRKLQTFVDEVAQDNNLIADLRPFMQKIAVKQIAIDAERIKSDYMLPTVPHIYVPKYGSVAIACNECNFKMEIPRKIAMQKYSHIKIANRLAVKLTEVAYYRKNYDLQDAMYNVKEIENTGYYIIDEEVYEEWQAKVPDVANQFSLKEIREGNLVYFEWY